MEDLKWYCTASTDLVDCWKIGLGFLIFGTRLCLSLQDVKCLFLHKMLEIESESYLGLDCNR